MGLRIKGKEKEISISTETIEYLILLFLKLIWCPFFKRKNEIKSNTIFFKILCKGVIGIISPKHPQLLLLPFIAQRMARNPVKNNSKPMLNLDVKERVPMLLINNSPIKNSVPIINLAKKGERLQLEIPISTKVYSNGSIGNILLYAEKIYTPPINTEIVILKIK